MPTQISIHWVFDNGSQCYIKNRPLLIWVFPIYTTLKNTHTHKKLRMRK